MPPGVRNSRSLSVSFISENQWTNITTVAAENTTPDHGCSQRHTDRPPNKVAIQPKSGVQMGSPLKRQTKKNSATVQWITREERRWRTVSAPPPVASFPRAPAPPAAPPPLLFVLPGSATPLLTG